METNYIWTHLTHKHVKLTGPQDID